MRVGCLLIICREQQGITKEHLATGYPGNDHYTTITTTTITIIILCPPMLKLLAFQPTSRSVMSHTSSSGQNTHKAVLFNQLCIAFVTFRLYVYWSMTRSKRRLDIVSKDSN